MSRKALIYTTGALVILWMVIVFILSNQPSYETKNTSLGFTKILVNIIAKTTDITEIEKEEVIIQLNPYIRKIAHYLLYTIGGIFIIINVKQYKNLNKENTIIISTIIGILYAITDEIHQYFVPGRSSKIQDVYIDALGIITGIIFVVTIIKLYNKIRHKEIGE